MARLQAELAAAAVTAAAQLAEVARAAEEERAAAVRAAVDHQVLTADLALTLALNPTLVRAAVYLQLYLPDQHLP